MQQCFSTLDSGERLRKLILWQWERRRLVEDLASRLCKAPLANMFPVWLSNPKQAHERSRMVQEVGMFQADCPATAATEGNGHHPCMLLLAKITIHKISSSHPFYRELTGDREDKRRRQAMERSFSTPFGVALKAPR
jgi:hypothetical protein